MALRVLLSLVSASLAAAAAAGAAHPVFGDIPPKAGYNTRAGPVAGKVNVHLVRGPRDVISAPCTTVPTPYAGAAHARRRGVAQDRGPVLHGREQQHPARGRAVRPRLRAPCAAGEPALFGCVAWIAWAWIRACNVVCPWLCAWRRPVCVVCGIRVPRRAARFLCVNCTRNLFPDLPAVFLKTMAVACTWAL
jgi:hypothetical protein